MLPVIFFLCQSRGRRGAIEVNGSVVLQLYGLSETRFGFLYSSLRMKRTINTQASCMVISV